ncbi:MAG: formate dehydrogenase accessory protein FdhE [Actinomycetota bacterium]|nr:formate dehydrogenase accessory protein FdhE [Actinomycetota bacterium]
MRRGVRGGPGSFGERYARACAIEPTAAVAAPLSLLTAVLAHQENRASQPRPTRCASEVAAAAEERRSAGLYPLLDLSPVAPAIFSEVAAAVAALTGAFPVIVPDPLAEAGNELTNGNEPDRRALVEAWLDDPTLLDPRLGFWIGVAAAPILEPAAAGVTAPARSEWNGVACPLCGGPPQASVIAEESGEFMAGSPRNLVCSRCATWWAFARAVCPTCGEDDSRRIAAFSADEFPWARVDACENCHTYLKGFDLRQPGARDVIPLVDDVATLVLDLWAGDHGYHRTSRSLAGV